MITTVTIYTPGSSRPIKKWVGVENLNEIYMTFDHDGTHYSLKTKGFLVVVARREET